MAGVDRKPAMKKVWQKEMEERKDEQEVNGVSLGGALRAGFETTHVVHPAMLLTPK
jgi:hypothetical protein